MFLLPFTHNKTRPAADRYEFALRSSPTSTTSSRPKARQKAADDHLYFSARSVSANGFQHVLQYAFVDDRGNVVLSALGAAPSPVPGGPHEPSEPMPVEPLDAGALEYLLSRVCDGANLVTFGRVLQAGMLPPNSVRAADTVDCAWRRFLKLGRRRWAAFDRNEPLNLSDALATAGLKPLDSHDAVMRALAIRELWMWMDGIELGREAV
jgi:hypothetical protein